MPDYLLALSPPPVSAPPSGKRFPFGWRAFALRPNQEPPRLTWEGEARLSGPVRFRLTVALDDRDDKTVEVALAGSGEMLGRVELRFADALQTFEMILEESEGQLAFREGVTLRLARGATPLYLLCADASLTMPRPFSPHLLSGSAGDRWEAFFKRFCSLDSLEPFGWPEGCVLDGLMDLDLVRPDLGAREAAEDHWGRFLAPDGQLIYEDPRSQPWDGRIYGIEGTLPFASLARIYPDHPLLRLVVAFWRERIAQAGAVLDPDTISSEGCYTCAYPMAVVAKARGIEWLGHAALNELRLRRDKLVSDGQLYLRLHPATGERAFANWARGVAWYMLGLSKTLLVLSDWPDTADLRAEFSRVAEWVLGYQRDGLWRSFLDDHRTLPETSGSAGIAAALATGAWLGLVGPDMRLAAARTLVSLTPFLAPDGFLSGVAPSNKGGEPLQRSNYRISKRSGMGLVACLVAALKSATPTPVTTAR